MKCKACNTTLTDEEATTKALDSNEFLDECITCQGNLYQDVYELTEENYEDYG